MLEWLCGCGGPFTGVLLLFKKLKVESKGLHCKYFCNLPDTSIHQSHYSIRWNFGRNKCNRQSREVIPFFVVCSNSYLLKNIFLYYPCNCCLVNFHCSASIASPYIYIQPKHFRSCLVAWKSGGLHCTYLLMFFRVVTRIEQMAQMITGALLHFISLCISYCLWSALYLTLVCLDGPFPQ